MAKQTFPEYSTHYPLLMTTFMQRPVNLYPNDIGVVYRDDTGKYYRFTWLQWYERTCQLANALKSVLKVNPGTAGIPGDRVATMALNHHRHLELIYGSSCNGTVAHPVNIRLSPQHIIHTINHAEDKVIFFDDIFLPLLEGIYDAIKGTVKAFVYMSDKPGLPKTKIAPLYEYEEMIKNQPKTYDWPYLDENTPATLYYTTGTTGLPKGVMFTHRQLYLQSIHLMVDTYADPVPAFIPRDPPIFVDMINVPIFHIHAWAAPWYRVYMGGKVVLPGKFTPEAFCEMVQTEKVTHTNLVPTMLAMIVEYKDFKKWDTNSLQIVRVGGAALSLGLKTKLEAMFKNFSAFSGYGMTETAAPVLAPNLKHEMADWPKEKINETVVKTGLPWTGIEAKVVDADGKEVPHDNQTQGEIVLRGHWIMEQYYKDPEKTAASWRDGWFHTGDAAKVDTDGYIIIVDRITDVIRSGAEMVPTVLLENITALADFVLEATFVGVPDEKWGERPMALVRLFPGATQNEDDILNFLKKEGVEKGKIMNWMLPDFIAITNDVPKTSVGKYDKIAIRKRLPEFLAKAKKMTR
jgi:acyl-CoA synthetase (AMP-forming)/AMP-acid ligase II